MVVNKRKKFSRQRASHTHGWGSKKKHRGAGNRGGRGMAGTGKRADQIKTLIWKERYFGKYGFVPKGVKKDIRAINIGYIEENLGKFFGENLISKENDVYVVDLEKLGYNKLLGDGRIVNKFKIKTEYASGKVIEKVKKAGGIVVQSKKSVKEKTEEVKSSE